MSIWDGSDFDFGEAMKAEALGPCAGCGKPAVVLDDNLEALCRNCAEGCRISSAGENIQ